MTTFETLAADVEASALTPLRVATAGSVDDGKSTLIGRLLHDAKGIFEDQLAAVTQASRRYGDGDLNLALLTDGLRAEREQGITIDVAYRYFATPARTFVLADTPGHAQYTRNMVTGASVSDVAVVLVDARHGVVAQTARHLAVATLLGVHTVVVAVNKMDLAAWNEDVFDSVVVDIRRLASAVPGDVPVVAVPVSALHGDNVVERSAHTPWYVGPSLLELLEAIDVTPRRPVGARLAVQWVIRPHGAPYHDSRGYAGTLTGGPLAVGDRVRMFPRDHVTTVTAITRAGTPVDVATSGQAVAVTLADDLDAGRGTVIAAADAPTAPIATRELVGDISWLVERPLLPGGRWIAKHLTTSTTATVESIDWRLDPETMSTAPATELALNDLGRVRLRLADPVVADRYVDHHEGGRLVLIDPRTNDTAAAVIVREVEGPAGDRAGRAAT